jgi:hypothetical protein
MVSIRRCEAYRLPRACLALLAVVGVFVVGADVLLAVEHGGQAHRAVNHVVVRR